jgi:hypothetical protein
LILRRKKKMSNCINRQCRLCPNLVISDAVTVVTVDGVDTLVIDIPAGGCYCDNKRVCLVVAQTVPTTATINQPVAISIGGDTTTVYPILNCDCTKVTACAIRTRTKYSLCINTTATSAVFRSRKPLPCYPATTLAAIPATAAAAASASAVFAARSTAAKTTAKTTTVKEVQA